MADKSSTNEIDLAKLSASVAKSGTAPVVRGAGLPGEIGVGRRQGKDRRQLVVMVHKDLVLSRAGGTWKGYGVLAVPSTGPMPALKASTITRNVKAGSKVKSDGKGWDIVARVQVEIDPADPTVAKWTKCQDIKARVPKTHLVPAQGALEMAMRWAPVDKPGDYLSSASNEVIANRITGLGLRAHCREYELALATDDPRERLKIAIDAMGRDIAKQTWRETASRLAYVPLSPQARDEVNRLIERIDEADDETSAEREMRVLGHLARLPWGEPAFPPSVDRDKALQHLNSTHYGLEEPKTELLRLQTDLLWWQRRMRETGNVKLPTPQLPVICLYGPNRNGKTTLAHSLAHVFGREFYRIPVGSINSVEKLKGFQPTYVGSKAGAIVNALSSVGTTNVVILLDEIDKLAGTANGAQVYSALMELFDPSQRHAWVDDMLEGIPVDVSNVIFVCTANNINLIPAQVRSRIDFIEVPGYSPVQKAELAKSHLIPRARTKHSLTAAEFDISDQALAHVIKEYTHEAGVGQLISSVDRLARGTQDRLLSGEPAKVIEPDDANQILGELDVKYKDPAQTGPPGYFRSLAVSGSGNGVVLGGKVIARKAIGNRGGKVIFTGNIGPTWRQSAQVVETLMYTLVPALWKKHFGGEFPKDFMESHDLHFGNYRYSGVEGPSAGAMTVMAAASAASGVPLRGDVLMTGTITPDGDVQAVGGVDAKILAAFQVGAKKVIIPSECVGYLRKLPSDVIDPARGGLEVVAVDHIDQVFDIFFDREHVAPFLEKPSNTTSTLPDVTVSEVTIS